MKDILKEITRLRLERNWTEYELAKKSGLAQSTISSWYRKKQTPSIQGLGITLSQFFGEGDDAIFLTPEQRKLLDSWSALNTQQRKIVTDLLDNVL